MLTPSVPLESLVLDTLDLERRYVDCRRLIRAHPAYRGAVAAGYNREDLLQDVFLRLLSKQRGKSRYDPTRASLGKYMFQVTWSAVLNFVRDHKRHDDRLVPMGAGPILETEEGYLAYTTSPSEGTCEARDLLDPEAQLAFAADELGLSPYLKKVLQNVAAGTLRPDDHRVVALGEVVRRRMAGEW